MLLNYFYVQNFYNKHKTYKTSLQNELFDEQLDVVKSEILSLNSHAVHMLLNCIEVAR